MKKNNIITKKYGIICNFLKLFDYLYTYKCYNRTVFKIFTKHSNYHTMYKQKFLNILIIINRWLFLKYILYVFQNIPKYRLYFFIYLKLCFIVLFEFKITKNHLFLKIGLLIFFNIRIKSWNYINFLKIIDYQRINRTKFKNN